MSEWITLIALVFQIFKYFEGAKKQKAVTKASQAVIFDALRKKLTPMAILWELCENVTGFADALDKHNKNKGVA